MREIDKVHNFSLFFIVSYKLILLEEGDLKYTTINLFLLISGILTWAWLTQMRHLTE